MRLIDQHRTGVTPEHRGAQFSGADFACARLTVLAREALLAAGATITPAEPPQMLDQLTGAWTPSTAPHWRVQLGHRCPAGLIVIVPGASQRSLHMTGEAIDISDDDSMLDDWINSPAGTQALMRAELWAESRNYTPRWCHVQIRPPRSGLRFFVP
jgi:hypothetical protein